MRLHGRALRRPWMLAVGAVLLIAGHGFLFHALSKIPLPVVVVSGGIILIAIKHLGLFGLLYARLRRRSRPRGSRGIAGKRRNLDPRTRTEHNSEADPPR